MNGKVSQLSPCPFCGGSSALYSTAKTSVVYCAGCHAYGSPVMDVADYDEAVREAVFAWNHIVPETGEKSCSQSIVTAPPICKCCKRPMGEGRIIPHDAVYLRDCPFCGGKAQSAFKETKKGLVFYIECPDCKAHGSFIRGDMQNISTLMKKAAFKWNKREADLMGDLEP